MIKLITDSAADVPKKEAEEYGIRVMPIPITVDGVTYREGVDFTSEEYYGILTSAKAIPTTAQITLVEFAEAFQEEIAQGNRHLICVTITSQGSGIYNAACLARKMVLEKQPAGGEEVTIDVVDSAAYTYVYGHAVVKAAKAAREGMDREGVLELLHRELTTYRCTSASLTWTSPKKAGASPPPPPLWGRCWGSGPCLPSTTGRPTPSKRCGGTTSWYPPWWSGSKSRPQGTAGGFTSSTPGTRNWPAS